MGRQERAFRSRLYTGIIANIRHVDVGKFLDDAHKIFVLRAKAILKERGNLKANTVLLAKFKKDHGGEEVVDLKNFATKNVRILQTTDLDEWYVKNVKEVILKKIEEFQEQESGWTLDSIINLEVNFNYFNPFKGSSYIDLPPPIMRKKACINVQNEDQKCFMWAILSALHPLEEHGGRVVNYSTFQNELCFDSIQFPVPLHQISRFEVLNNISVNVYGLNYKNRSYTVVPLHLTSEKKEKHVNSLKISTSMKMSFTMGRKKTSPTVTTFGSRTLVVWFPCNYPKQNGRNSSAIDVCTTSTPRRSWKPTKKTARK